MGKLILPTEGVSIAQRGTTALSSTTWWMQFEHLYQHVMASDQQRWLLFADDSFDFSCALMALLVAGRVPVLPPNQQADTIKTLIPHVDAICSDKKIAGHSPDCLIDFSKLNPTQCSAVFSLNDISSDNEIYLYTSGSTGEPKKIVKQWRQLFTEVEALERNFSPTIDGALLAATVSHQHIYGLLFAVLWPLLTQRCWLVESITYPEQLASLALLHDIALVSSPSFLKHLVEDGSGLSFAPQCCFSSGGPLDPDVASALKSAWGASPSEVFGSSETGGVAYRRQFQDRSWQVFANIDWRINPLNSALEIRSPYLTDTQHWYQMDDAVQAYDEGFVLKGRLDRVVKVAEKRVCLDQMRHCLLAHAWLKDADLLTIDQPRYAIAAVVVLNDAGLAALAANKHQLNQGLRQHLRQEFEAVTLPRKWRYVSSLPLNNQGKRQLNKMQELFL